MARAPKEQPAVSSTKRCQVRCQRWAKAGADAASAVWGDRRVLGRAALLLGAVTLSLLLLAAAEWGATCCDPVSLTGVVNNWTCTKTVAVEVSVDPDPAQTSVGGAGEDVEGGDDRRADRSVPEAL